MKTAKGLYKTPEQIRFAELFEQLGWKPSQVAEAIRLSRSAVTMILKGRRNPRAMTLAAMEELVRRASGAKAHVEQIEAKADSDEIQKNLAILREHYPEGLAAAARMVSVLADSVKTEREAIKSARKVDRAAAELLRLGAEKAKKKSPADGKSPAATGSTNGHTSS